MLSQNDPNWRRGMQAPTFSQRHYVAIAVMLRDTRPGIAREIARAQWQTMVMRIAKDFLNDNPKFNLRKFYSAIGFHE